jgi:hypothetical protein
MIQFPGKPHIFKTASELALGPAQHPVLQIPWALS